MSNEPIKAALKERNVATKDDLAQLEQRLTTRIQHAEELLRSGLKLVAAEIKQLDNVITIKIGSMFIIAVGILLAMQGLLR